MRALSKSKAQRLDVGDLCSQNRAQPRWPIDRVKTVGAVCPARRSVQAPRPPIGRSFPRAKMAGDLGLTEREWRKIIKLRPNFTRMNCNEFNTSL
jgi:hypothetical protein